MLGSLVIHFGKHSKTPLKRKGDMKHFIFTKNFILLKVVGMNINGDISLPLTMTILATI
jgi:hypothetical protein